MEKELVCIGCPKGCSIRVKPAADDITAAADGKPAGTMEFTGYGCKRGLQYALDECTHPVRTLTTTVRSAGHSGALVSVKSSKPLPKELLFDCMRVINAHTAAVPLKVGDVIIKNILGTGIDILSTADSSGEENVWTDGISSHWIRERQAQGQSYLTGRPANLPSRGIFR